MERDGCSRMDGAAPARAQLVSGQPRVCARRDFIFLAAWQGMGDVPAIGSSGDALCPGVDGSLAWALGGASPIGCSGRGVLAAVRCELQIVKDAPRKMGFGKAGELTRTQAGIVPCPTDWRGLVPRSFPHWWGS